VTASEPSADHPAVNPEPPATSAPHDDSVSPWLIALFLFAITVLAYWPTFSNGFINYDDPGYVTQNRFLQPGLTLNNIVWAFRATIMANWHPFTWISHMADLQFFGLNPAGHHATSLFLHVLNVVLLFCLLRAATGFLWRSASVAALFALHPFNVECVAWVSERKSLLCTTFLFLALFAYGWYVRKPGAARYSVVALLFAQGLASKPMIITLPFALLLLDYWPLNRLPVPDSPENASLFFQKLWSLTIEKIPLLFLSAASAWITVIAQARANTIAANSNLALPVRAANAFWSYLLYLLKSVWPLHLVIFYPHPEKTIGFAKPLLAVFFLLAFTYFCLRNLHQRYLLAGWLWYLGCLVPVIGFVQVGRQAMADRYPYVPLIGIFVLAVWWIAESSSHLSQRSEIMAGAAALFLIFFAGLTWRQTTYWKDSFTVFRHALEITPVNFIAENNLGQAYVDAGKSDLAYDHFLRSAQEKPFFGLAHYNLGVVLVGQHRRSEARREFELAIKYGQDVSEIASAYHNLGIVMLESGELVDARIALSEALRLVPNKQSSFLARGLAEFRLGDYASAETDFVNGANLAPDPSAAYWVGRSREALGNTAGAIDAYRRTLALQPSLTEAKEHLDALLSGHPLPFSKSEN
jgi:protein O-mannosyl-transferase